jgi:hypothetical protein
MIERQHRSNRRAARRGSPPSTDVALASEPTLPGVPIPRTDGTGEATVLGFPAEPPTDAEDDGIAVEPQLSVVRRPDRVAGSALILAGVAANVSLWLPWVAGEGQTGISLFRRGIGVADSGWDDLLRSGLWQPVAVVLGGGVLVLLGMLLLVPAHTHRFVGVLALLVALAAAAAVLTLLASVDWRAERFDGGLWAGAGVAVFGVFGALKAMLTLPLVTMPDDVT